MTYTLRLAHHADVISILDNLSILIYQRSCYKLHSTRHPRSFDEISSLADIVSIFRVPCSDIYNDSKIQSAFDSPLISCYVLFRGIVPVVRGCIARKSSAENRKEQEQGRHVETTLVIDFQDGLDFLWSLSEMNEPCRSKRGEWEGCVRCRLTSVR